MRIDTSTIENYENMTLEEKVATLEGLDVTDTDTEKKYKDLISKANSEAKKYKDQARAADEKLKSQMSDDERARQEREDEFNSIKAENDRLKREQAISQKTNFYLKMHMSEEQAKATAEAFVDGDFATVEKNQLEAQENWEKDVRADVARNNPQPNNAGGVSSITKAEIMAVKDIAKRQKLIAEHMDLFTK